MHSICVEEQKGLVVKFELTEDYTVNFKVDDFLCTAGYEKVDSAYIYPKANLIEFEKTIKETVEYFIKTFGKERIDMCNEVESSLRSIEENKESFEEAKIMGERIKNKKEHRPNISKTFCRELMEYQKESVEHMMTLGNTANFSVPGSGKTTITYAAISRWLDDHTVDKILVIGPTASFLPWEEEYNICFGKRPTSLRISGGYADKFHKMDAPIDLFLMHFQTAMDRESELQQFMKKWKTVLIIDESHYIKSPKLKRWASTAINIAPYAERRIVLSGTPMPNNEKDLWTQITFLWPKNHPLDHQVKYNTYVKRYGIGKYREVLNSLFCRIKKRDLCLPDPKWHLINVPLKSIQREIYNAIAVKTLKEIEVSTISDQGKLQKFRMAKMIRLLQTASNPSLLSEKSSTFDIDSDTFSEQFGFAPKIDSLPKIDPTLVDQIKDYSRYEIPSKMVCASKLARDLIREDNKVIIWSSFIHNMSVFQNALLKEFNPIVINGTITREQEKKGNRDELINDFKNNPNSKVLIASPASLGESVSLHKNSKNQTVCNHAIYLDRNFNGAQYMQSMDRIHRIGMDKSVQVNYYLIVAQDTIDEVVHKRLNEKWKDMLDALNDDMLKSLEINPTPETNSPDKFIEDYKQTIEHLRKWTQENDSCR